MRGWLGEVVAELMLVNWE